MGLLKESGLILNNLGISIQLRGISEKFINDGDINKLVLMARMKSNNSRYLRDIFDPIPFILFYYIKGEKKEAKIILIFGLGHKMTLVLSCKA